MSGNMDLDLKRFLFLEIVTSLCSALMRSAALYAYWWCLSVDQYGVVDHVEGKADSKSISSSVM